MILILGKKDIFQSGTTHLLTYLALFDTFPFSPRTPLTTLLLTPVMSSRLPAPRLVAAVPRTSSLAPLLSLLPEDPQPGPQREFPPSLAPPSVTCLRRRKRRRGRMATISLCSEVPCPELSSAPACLQFQFVFSSSLSSAPACLQLQLVFSSGLSSAPACHSQATRPLVTLSIL